MYEDNRPQPYSLRLEPETRTKLEAIAKANGRSLNTQIVLMLESALVNPTLHLGNGVRRKLEESSKAGGRTLEAEISMRLEDSLLPRPKTEWKHMLDPAVYSLLEGEASRWSQTFEEALNYRLQLAFDKRLTGLLLEDLSSEAEALKMSEGRTVSIGTILDRRVRDGYLETKKTAYPLSDPENLQEQKYDGSKFDKYADEFMKELIAQTVREQLAKAGIKPVNE